MTYCDEKKIIFVHLVKTGGSSIKEAFSMPWGNHMMVEELFDDSLSSNKKISKGEERHFSSVDEIKMFKEKIRARWDSYYKFSFVRNPWDRVISEIFFNIKRGKLKGGEIKKKILNKCKGSSENVWNKNYIEWLINSSGGVDLDFIGRFENLQSDINKICDDISIKRRTLKRLNTSRRKNYAEYYEKEQMLAVKNTYQKDVDYFGYKFNMKYGFKI